MLPGIQEAAWQRRSFQSEGVSRQRLVPPVLEKNSCPGGTIHSSPRRF